MYNTQNASLFVDERSCDATFTAPADALPGVLLVHGWESDQAHYQPRTDDLVALGSICLTFDLQGHGRDAARSNTVSRDDNLKDVLAAYDLLAAHPRVDRRAIAIIGTSYGGYLGAIASAMRPVRWLALRVPALYPDAQWRLPKAQIDRDDVARYRSQVQPTDGNRALSACAAFKGDALVVGSGSDKTVPRPAITSYVRAFQQANSMTHRFIENADHELSDERARRTYDSLLMAWLNEMLLGARAQLA